MTSPHKITFFSGVFLLSFLGFCFLSLKIDSALLNDISSLSLGTTLLFLLFLFLQIAATVFLAIIPSSRLLLLIPLLLSLFAGTIVYNSPFLTLLTLGVPFILLFWTVHLNVKTRIKLRMTEDIRRPLTTFFLLVIFFGSFALAPRYDTYFYTFLGSFIEKSLPASSSSPEKEKGTTSFSDLVDSAIAPQLKLCEGDSDCEALLRKEAERQFREGVEKFPLLGKIDLQSDTPIAEGVSQEIINQMKEGTPFQNKYIQNATPGLFWGMITFLLFSPLSLIFSFFAMIFIRILYTFCRLTGILSVTTKNVQQEIIV